MANEIFRQVLDSWSPTETQTFTIPESLLSYDRLSLWIIPFGQAVTVDLKVKFPTVGGPETVLLTLNKGGAAAAGEAFPFTTEDLYPGDLLVDITSGGAAPSRVELVALVKR